jgi:hypothetical protein
MSQRNSGYERKERDFYETPEWVTEALMPHLPARLRIWEPAAGSGRMVRALRTGGHVVEASDIAQGCDFLLATEAMRCDAVVTNPPYVAAEAFIERAGSDAANWHRGDAAAHRLRPRQDAATSFLRLPGLRKEDRSDEADRVVRRHEGGAELQSCLVVWNHSHRGPPTLAYEPAQPRTANDGISCSK